MREKFEIIMAMMKMMTGMYGFTNTDYGRGVIQGISSTIRALGLEKEFEEYRAGKEAEAKNDNTVLSDRVE